MEILEEEKRREQEELQRLVDIAFHAGVLEAIQEARKLNDPYILDAFHDVLVDKLRDELISRAKLEEQN